MKVLILRQLILSQSPLPFGNFCIWQKAGFEPAQILKVPFSPKANVFGCEVIQAQHRCIPGIEPGNVGTRIRYSTN